MSDKAVYLTTYRINMPSLIVSASSGADFKIHPEGVVAARCTRIVDLGTQQSEFQGKAKSLHKIMFAFESEQVMDDDAGDYAGKPYLITTRYTASLSEKASLRKALESWRGKKFTAEELEQFDLRNVLGKACLINMVHNESGGKTYANIASIMPLPPSMKANPAVGELVFFSLSDFEQEAFDKLSERLQETITKSPEYKALKEPVAPAWRQAAAAAIDDDDIPF